MWKSENYDIEWGGKCRNESGEHQIGTSEELRVFGSTNSK